MYFIRRYFLFLVLAPVKDAPENAVYKDVCGFGFGCIWRGVGFQIRTWGRGFRGFWEVGGGEVDVGDLFAATDVVEDYHPVVIEIDGIDKHVDDALAKFGIHRIAGTKLLHP